MSCHLLSHFRSDSTFISSNNLRLQSDGTRGSGCNHNSISIGLHSAKRSNQLTLAARPYTSSLPRSSKCIFIVTLCRSVELRAEWLFHQLARISLAHSMLTGTAHRTTPPLRAQKFPEAMSPSTPGYPGSGSLPAASASCSPAPGPSVAEPGPRAAPKLFPPAVVCLLGDSTFTAGRRGCLPVRHCHFNLPKKAHHLLRRMPFSSCHSRLLSYQFLSLQLVQKKRRALQYFCGFFDKLVNSAVVHTAAVKRDEVRDIRENASLSDALARMEDLIRGRLRPGRSAWTTTPARSIPPNRL